MDIRVSVEGIDGVIDALNRIVSDDKLSKGIEKESIYTAETGAECGNVTT